MDVAEVIGLLLLLFFIFRFTAAAAFLALALLNVFFPWHRNRRVLVLAYALFLVALAVPVDVYVRGFHGPLVGAKGTGPRLVPVLYGLGARPAHGEAILGGCVAGLHDSRWRLAWD